MKKLLIGLLALGNISTFANCNVFIDGDNANRASSKVTRAMNLLGYEVVDHIDDADSIVRIIRNKERLGGRTILGSTVLLIDKTSNEVIDTRYSANGFLFYSVGPALDKMARKAPRCYEE